MRASLTLTLLLVAACSTAEDGPTDSPAAASSRIGGIEYGAETLIMESFPVQLRTIVTARNPTDAPVVLEFGNPCVAHLRVYADSARSGLPLWDQERVTGCIAVVFEDTIAPGDTAQYVAPNTDAREVLGDSLPDGRYWLAAALRPNGRAIEVPAGVADLAIPRD